MFTSGLIYDSTQKDGDHKPSDEPSAKVTPEGGPPSKFKRFFYHLIRTFSLGLIIFAVLGLFFSFYPVLSEKISFSLLKKAEQKSGFGEILKRVNAQNRDLTIAEARKLGVDPYFSIYVPKIDAKSNIIANVDSGKKVEYLKALKKGVAHAKGTNFPGQGKLIYLFSHSTDSILNFTTYNAVFYLLSELEKGDLITIYFLDKKFEYKVTDKIIVPANDTSWLRDNNEGEILILQACYPPGTSLKRLIIYAKLSS